MARSGVEMVVFSSSLSRLTLHGRPHVSRKPSMQQEQQAVTSVSINQSIITSNSLVLFFLPLSASHAHCINQGLGQEGVVAGVQHAKGCPYCPGHTDHKETRSVLSSSCSLACVCFVYPSLSTLLDGLKGKVVVFTPWMVLFPVKRRAACVHFSFLRSLCNTEEDIYM